MKCRKEFINLFEEILQHRFDAKTFEVFDPIIDNIHKNLRPKISLVGFSGVGKTTITKLIRAEEIPVQHIPTITGDIATVRIGKLHFHLWDFAGQEQFSYLWNNFIKGSDAVLLITDSTLENVEKSKFFLELIKEQAPHAHAAVIGNKQDLTGATNPTNIERILGLKSYSMIAKEPNNRDKMIQIIADILEMSAEISPLLKPLLERDKLIEEATTALKSANFDKAAFLFDKISYLCIDLGDDSLSKEFFDKAQKIKVMLDQVGAPQPTPAFPIETDRSKINQEPAKTVVQKPIAHVNPAPSIKELEIPNPPAPKLPPKKTVPAQHPVNIAGTQDLTKKMELSRQPLTKQEDLKQPQMNNSNQGLQLNPDDFMVKIRSKTIGHVPKDAKSKLTTAAFGHVKNVPSQNSKGENQLPFSIFKEEKQQISAKPVSVTKPIEISTQAKIEDTIPQSQPIPQPQPISKSLISIDIQQEEHARKTLIELKLKKADLNKMTLDFEMKELTGEITSKELKEKMKKIRVYEKKIDNQILEMQKLLKG
ncbi:MAG: ADP-ribosylation factor-like protein [Promethearchaeota archaeon]